MGAPGFGRDGRLSASQHRALKSVVEVPVRRQAFLNDGEAGFKTQKFRLIDSDEAALRFRLGRGGFCRLERVKKRLSQTVDSLARSFEIGKRVGANVGLVQGPELQQRPQTSSRVAVCAAEIMFDNAHRFL